jgi:cAMP-dependent protein kinase regulator
VQARGGSNCATEVEQAAQAALWPVVEPLVHAALTHGRQRIDSASVVVAGILAAQRPVRRTIGASVDAEQLKSVPLFESMSDDMRRKFAVWINELEVSEGKHLVDEGDYSYDLFIIEDGSAEVRQDGNHVADLGPGDFFGEMGVLKRAQRSATVVAKSPMRLLTLSSWDVDRLRKSAPEVLDELERAIEQRS